MQPTFQLALLVCTFMFASLHLYKTPKLDAYHNAYKITKHKERGVETISLLVMYAISATFCSVFSSASK